MISTAHLKLVPLLKCSNVQRSLDFYTKILDFTIKYPGIEPTQDFVIISNGQAELQFSGFDGTVKGVLNIYVEDVDALFSEYVKRGLDTSGKQGVHRSPLDQTWGSREFYVTDSDGHTLRFVQW